MSQEYYINSNPHEGDTMKVHGCNGEINNMLSISKTIF
jgi:hypothetical protein